MVVARCLNGLATYENGQERPPTTAGSINYYHRFILNAAQLQTPLFELTSSVKGKDDKLFWTPERHETFDKARNALADTLCLSYLKPNAKLRLCTNASNTVIGAVLEQFYDGL